MSDNIRVRLEFKGFDDKSLKNSLLSFKRSETRDVQSLEALIGKRYRLRQRFLLFIDSFVLERTEPIEILRDNDLIVIEPKVDDSLPSSSSSSVSMEIKPKPKIKIGPKSRVKRTDDYDNLTQKSLSEVKTSVENTLKAAKNLLKCDPKARKSTTQRNDNKRTVPINTSVPIKSEKGIKREANTTAVPIKSEKGFKRESNTSNTGGQPPKRLRSDVKPDISIIKIERKPEVIDDEIEILSVRDIPLRKAFKSAMPSLKEKTQPLFRSTPSTSSEGQTHTSRPKKKRATKEATEPVDQFSPVIVLDRCVAPQVDHYFDDIIKKKLQELEALTSNAKQSARKTFPKRANNNGNTDATPVSSDHMNGKNYDNVSNTKPEEKKSTILFEELEPLTGNPNVGDLLAFKMLTMSSDGHTMEASPFNVGSALHVNKDTRMVDILLQDTLHRQRNAKTDYNREEHPSHIISLKINWSTVLEPKLIQRAQTKIS